MKKTLEAKKDRFDEWYHEVLLKGDIVDIRYPVKGMVAWKPYGYKALKLIIKEAEKLLEETGHEEAYFPMLIPTSIFNKESDFLEGFGGESFVVTKAGDRQLNDPLIVRPTSETVMYEFFSKWIRSYQDLPLKIFQTVNIFRYETKMTKALLRVREVIKFMEAHTAHASMQEADEQIKEGIEIYKKLMNFLLIPHILLKTPKWDTFAGAEYNYDLVSVLPDGKAVELGSVINLGQRFAKAFHIKFKDRDGEDKYVYQTCYGISERLLGVVIAVHGDDYGIIFPPSIAPIQVVIIPIIFKENKERIFEKCEKIERMLKEKGIRVKFDSRDESPGEKFYYWELKGVPIRIEIGPKEVENGEVVIVFRDNREKKIVRDEEVIEAVENAFDLISTRLFERAKRFLQSKIVHCKSIEEAKDVYAKNKGIVSLPWCGEESCGMALMEKVEIPVIGYDEKPCEGKCPCGRKAKTRLYFGRSY